MKGIPAEDKGPLSPPFLPLIHRLHPKMKIIYRILTLAAALIVSGCNPVKSTAEADRAATEFHTLFNAEDYERIYESSHADFKGSQPKTEIINFIRSVRERLGTVKSATKTGWRASSYNLKTNVVLTYSIDFENGSGIETFTYQISDGKASLLGWHINSRELTAPPARAEPEGGGNSVASP